MQGLVQKRPGRDEDFWRWLRLLAFAVVGLLVATCTPWSVAEAVRVRRGAESHMPRAARSRAGQADIDHVVVVAIDGVRWQEVFYGASDSKSRKNAGQAASGSTTGASELLPNLHRIAQTQGVLLGNDDSRIAVSNPSTVSLPGYSELFSGRTSRCNNNDCGPTSEPTLLDEWLLAKPDAKLALVSSWSRIPRVAARDPSRLVITAGRDNVRNLSELDGDNEFQSMLEQGRRAQPSPGTEDYRPDLHTAETGLRILTMLEPDFLFLGLGDTDEYAHQGNYTAYLEALRRADTTIGRINAWLMSKEALGMRTLLVVTTDHGRAASFQNHGGCKEAARIWMLWSGNGVRGRGYPPATEGRLADLAPTLRQFLGLKPDVDPMAGVALNGVAPSPLQPSETSAPSFSTAVAVRR